MEFGNRIETPGFDPINPSVYWHCEVAAMILNQFPINAYTKQHFREAIRCATNSITSEPRFISIEAKKRLDVGDGDRGNLIKEHTIPVSVIIGKVMEQARPLIHIRDGNQDFVPLEQSAQFRLAKAGSKVEKMLALGNLRSWEIAKIVQDWTVLTWVTDDQDKKLRSKRLHTCMPGDWNGEDKFARYTACDIVCIER